MAQYDPFNVYSNPQGPSGPSVQAMPKAPPKPQAATPPNGPTGFWSRIGQVGVGQVNLLNIAHAAKSIGVSTAKAAEGTATGVARTLPGGQNDLKAEAQQSQNADKNTQNIIQKQKAGQLSKPQATRLLGQQAKTASQGSAAVTKTVKSEPTTKEFVGDVVQTALLAAPGAGKAVEVTGADLLKTFGTQGVKDLAEKAGVDVGGKGAIEGATQVAKTKLAQQAFKKATTDVVSRGARSSVKGAAGFGTYGAAQEAGAGGSNKQILKAGISGAKEGAIAGLGGSLLKSGVKAKLGKTPTIVKATAEKETPSSPVNTLGDKAKARTTLVGKKAVGGSQTSDALATPKTKLLGTGTGKVEGKGFTMTPATDASKAKLSARLNVINTKLNSVAQGKSILPASDIKTLRSEKADLISKSKESPLPSSAESATKTSTPVTTEQGSGTTTPKVSLKPSQKVSGSALRSEQEAVKAGLTSEFEDKATYKSGSYSDEAQNAVKLVHDNPERAMDIAMGKKPGNNLLHTSAVYHAVKNKAIAEGDTNTMQQLVTSSRHTAISQAAQKLGSEGYNATEHDPIALMRQVADAKAEAVSKKIGSVPKAVTSLAKEIATHEKAVSKDSWQLFVESIRC